MLTETADPAARRQIYNQYKLTDEHNVWGAPKWDRADGAYTLDGLDDVLGTYPTTQDLGHRAKVRNGVTTGIAAAGAALVGFTFGYNETAAGSQQMSHDTQVAMYGTGAGLVLTAIVMHLLWPNPLDHVSDTYNAALSRDLGLSGTAAATSAAPTIPPSRFMIAPTVVTDGSQSAAGLGAIGRF